MDNVIQKWEPKLRISVLHRRMKEKQMLDLASIGDRGRGSRIGHKLTIIVINHYERENTPTYDIPSGVGDVEGVNYSGSVDC
jgi:hypothetical protein